MKTIYYGKFINFFSIGRLSDRVGYYPYIWLSSNGTVTTLDFNYPNPLGCKVLQVSGVI